MLLFVTVVPAYTQLYFIVYLFFMNCKQTKFGKAGRQEIDKKSDDFCAERSPMNRRV